MGKKAKIQINYHNFWLMLALMFGFTIFSASVMSGGTLADQMSIKTGIIAIICGNFFLAIYGGLNAYIAKKTNKNLDGVLKNAFGKKGAFLPSMIMIISQIGWNGVGIGMIAIPIANEIGINPYVLVFPVALLIISTSFFGIKSLTLLSLIAVPLVIILGFTTIGIASSTNSITPTLKIKLGIWTGISLVIATFISGATFVPNFAINADNSKNAVITTILAFFVGNGLMISFGFIGGLFYEEKVFDFVSIAKKQGFMIVGLIILILNIWTTGDSALYSISLAFKNWFNLPKKAGVIIFGFIGAGASIFLYDNFIGFLSMLNAFIPAIGALIITSYLFDKEERNINKVEINFVMIAIWAFASGITFIPELKIFSPIVSFGTSFIISSLFIYLKNHLLKSKK